ncbi:hypothetical protein PCC7418_2350 [Halothece sp. PCC 7418]|uniref:DUF565 domain-containing protein n=1 Tax=Halothece sp. (strain PCC 7418) TaxID=65093 RepID=UPI0002A0741E|nr:DUF565 domain-containing protein [Halothece sp. PCC 7418]AFZ44499.1 hypothetical protein PCC7418_2350 [Halothece sp. PCC 7418]
MQKTRLNLLFSNLSSQVRQFFVNPWRKITSLLISLLLGIFMGIAIVTSAGQNGRLDIIVAALLLILTEVLSWFVYRQNLEQNEQRSGLIEVMNTFKIGLVYSLYIQAFVLGS